MALILESGSGLDATANAYVSVAECDIYHADFGNSAWTGTVAQKEAAIRQATRYLDGLNWRGARRLPTQPLQWPRVDREPGPVQSWTQPILSFPLGDRDGFPITGVPKAVKDACSEAALRALTAMLAPDVERQIASEVVGPIETVYLPGSTQPRYPVIERLLQGLITPPGGMSLIRA